MEWYNRLYFGTWQLGGQFKNLSPTYVESLLLFAISSGIRRFDTAAVYGGGSVEKLLGACLPKDAVIVTKIPATSKPDMKTPEPIQKFFSRDGIRRGVDESLERLRRASIGVALLHNWLPTWSEDAVAILECLNELKYQGMIQRVGISLPDNFSHPISDAVLSYIDVIEVPFNSEQRWVLTQLPTLIDLKKEVILRSLFSQGKLLAERSAESLIQDALKLETSVVIGMTTEEQITQNINCLKGELR